MKHIQYFNRYEKLNEKVSLNTILFMLCAAVGIHNVYKSVDNYDKIKTLYNYINSDNSIPKGKDKERVEEIRNQLIINCL